MSFSLILFLLAAFGIGYALFWALARKLPGFVVGLGFAVVFLIVVDLISANSILGIRFSRGSGGVSDWSSLGEAIIGIAVGPPLVLGAVIGWVRGAAAQKRSRISEVER